jgi:hypothetical protein
MANLKSFDRDGLQGKLAESREVIESYQQAGSFEKDSELYEFLDALDVGVSAAIEMVHRGEATPEQEEALYTYLQENGLL